MYNLKILHSMMKIVVLKFWSGVLCCVAYRWKQTNAKIVFASCNSDVRSDNSDLKKKMNILFARIKMLNLIWRKSLFMQLVGSTNIW